MRLQNNTQVPDSLIALRQIDLLGRYFPAAAAAHDTVAGPAGWRSRFLVQESADDKIRPQHARVVAHRGRYFRH